MQAAKEVSGTDIDGAAVKVGDRLLCVNAGASFHRLQAGNEYTAEAAYNGEPIVIAANAYHSLDRFRLIKGEAAKTRIRESGAISVAGGSPAARLTVPTQIAGRKATQREAVSGEPAQLSIALPVRA